MNSFKKGGLVHILDNRGGGGGGGGGEQRGQSELAFGNLHALSLWRLHKYSLFN